MRRIACDAAARDGFETEALRLTMRRIACDAAARDGFETEALRLTILVDP
jgi:hypothetical protein